MKFFGHIQKINSFNFCLSITFVLTLLIRINLSQINEKELNYDTYAKYSETHENFNDQYKYKNDAIEYGCLDPSILPKNKDGKIHMISASNKQKVESFQKGKCPPIVIVPGYIGTKLDFRITNCDLFSKYHSEIMNTCGWENCHANELKKFTIWLNMDIDINEILASVMGGNTNKKKDKKKKEHIPTILRSIKIENNIPIEYEFKQGCLGSLLRLYHKENNFEEIQINMTKVNTTEFDKKDLYNNSTYNDINNEYYKIQKLKGAEITLQTTTRGECGADSVSNILGNIFSVSNSFKGFHHLNSHLLKMGYIKGLSLFNVPYDFRLDMNILLEPIKRAIKTAYQINKKKVLLISHSFGGLLTLKLSGYHEEAELIKHIVFIGSPFLGTSLGAINSIAKYQNWDYENQITYFGINAKVNTKLDEDSVLLIAGSNPQFQFYPKSLLNDEIDLLLKRIIDIEKSFEVNFKENKLNYHMKDSIKNLYRDFYNKIEDEKLKLIIDSFYKIFPKPYKFCLSIPSKNKELVYSDICKINMFDFTEIPILKINNEKIILKNLLDENNQKHVYYLLEKYFNKTIDVMNKYSSKDNQLKHDKYFNYLLTNQEKKIFTEFKKNENIEYSFVYSNHMPTLEYSEFEEIQGKIKHLNSRYTNGDGTVTGFSQIYPGIRWLIKDLKMQVEENKEKLNNNRGDKNESFEIKGKINFVEYCALKPKNRKSNKNQSNDNENSVYNQIDEINETNSYDKNKKFQHLTIKCDCMTSTNLNPYDNCNHSAMINDSHFLNYISDIIISQNTIKYKSEYYKELYEIVFEDKMKCGNMFKK